MTKQHFEYLAKALKCEKPGDSWDPDKRVQWELDCKAIADACKHFNGRFDRERFLVACGID